jgi:hypothetical protein
VPWSEVLYATDFAWWERHQGAPGFRGLKISQDPKVRHRPQWGVRQVEVVRSQDSLLLGRFGTIGWGGNSGFGALNLAVQFGAGRIVLVGYDMRVDGGLHWHGAHPKGLHNPEPQNVARWRRVIDQQAPILKALGIEVINASKISALVAYPKMELLDALGAAQKAA